MCRPSDCAACAPRSGTTSYDRARARQATAWASRPAMTTKGGHGWSRPDVRKEVNHQALGTRGHPSQAGLPQPSSRRIPLTSAATKWHCVTHGCVLHDAAPQAVLRKALVCISLPQDPTGDARVVSAATPPEMVAPPSNLAPRSHEPSCSGLGINDIATRPRASHEHVLR
ncbi:MAG: hypothetical protein WDW38_005413 [Sanguina aurantia]